MIISFHLSTLSVSSAAKLTLAMKTLALVVLTVCVQSAGAQWIKQNVDTTASLRGLAVVNEKVVWASGTGGTVIRTIDGGKTWKVMTVPGAKQFDFRDVEAFNATTAYVLAIGEGQKSRIFKTVDGGDTWNQQFVNMNILAFYDALACWDENNCIAMSDPVHGHFLLTGTGDGGETWKQIDTANMPAATMSESAFAASGTCLIAHGKDGLFLVTGGGNSRVFRSDDRGRTWTVVATPLVKGRPGTGIFSIAMSDAKTGVIVGGDYEKPTETAGSLAFTSDAGKTWKAGNGLSGYRSAVAFVDRKTMIAVGTNGSDISRSSGKMWQPLGTEDLNAVQSRGSTATWAVGPKGLVVRLK